MLALWSFKYPNAIVCEFWAREITQGFHAGTLPAFRGLITCYYEILELGRIGVCAMFLKAKLDLGEILIQRHFSIQNLQALRAKKLKKIPKLKEPFYKIHPVLKNIAILKLCAS